MPYVHRDASAGLYHVYTHCVWAVPWLYRDETDRNEFLRHLARVTSKVEWTCIAYCLMTSHYHLIVGVDEGVLPVAMHSLNLAYARHHNGRHDLRGHVQFKRYGSTRIDDDADLLERFRYVVKNPVDAGLCSAPTDWAWSSYAGTIGVDDLSSFVDPTRLLAACARPWSDPRAVLRARVERP
jgi:REP element-mobilizing transposase RayT